MPIVLVGVVVVVVVGVVVGVVRVVSITYVSVVFSLMPRNIYVVRSDRIYIFLYNK